MGMRFSLQDQKMEGAEGKVTSFTVHPEDTIPRGAAEHPRWHVRRAGPEEMARRARPLPAPLLARPRPAPSLRLPVLHRPPLPGGLTAP